MEGGTTVAGPADTGATAAYVALLWLFAAAFAAIACSRPFYTSCRRHLFTAINLYYAAASGVAITVWAESAARWREAVAGVMRLCHRQGLG